MTYRKLSGAIAVVALGAAALIAFPPLPLPSPSTRWGYLAECSGAGDGLTATVNLFQTSAQGGFVEASGFIETPDGSTLQVTGFTDGDLILRRRHHRHRLDTRRRGNAGTCRFGDGQRHLHRFRKANTGSRGHQRRRGNRRKRRDPHSIERGSHPGVRRYDNPTRMRGRVRLRSTGHPAADRHPPLAPRHSHTAHCSSIGRAPSGLGSFGDP